jgi:hypothetical protein
MALAEETPRRLHVGNGTRGPYSLSVGGVPITFADSDHIIVTRYDSDGVPTPLVEGTDYDLSATSVLPPVGTAYPQTVTAATLTLDLSQDVLASDEHLEIERITPRTQEQVLTSGGGFSSASNERSYDAVVRQIQELSNKLERVLMIHPLDEDGVLELDLETADRDETKILGFAADGSLAVVDRPADGATGPTGATGATGPAGPAGSGAGDVLGPATNTDGSVPLWNGANTKTLKNATAAEGRTALGLGSAALLTSAQVFQVANNLSEGVAATMRTNLGLGSAALLASSAVAQTANNLSDLASASTARTNLGLGTAALLAETTTAQFLANTADKALSTDQVWAAGALYALTDAATIAVDMSLFINATVTLAGNRTLGQPSNTKVGQSGVIRIIQDGTGSRTLAYHADWQFAGGTTPVLSTAAGTIDLLYYDVIAANFIHASLVKAVS